MALSKDYSRTNYTVEVPSWDTVKIGALQRIADATEAMAKNYLQLQSDLAWKTQQYERAVKRAEKAENSNRSLRGVITKLRLKAGE